MMNLRQPILLPKEEPLRALIHARFSTEEQRQSSIDDQVASCRTFLESNLPKGWKPEQVEIDVIAEPEVSGEIADRPGINQVWAGIEARRWHLIIAEESSRLYRHHTKAGELFESAVDADVRVICTSDYIDTADDDWPDRLHMSQMQHARSNFYTRKRIERAHDGLWARGAAVGNTVIGYKRRPTLPATETEPAKGPFFDVIDEEKAVVIREVFERIAAGETAAEVGEWLDSIKFAKAKWSRQAKWTAGNVNAIIRRTIYRGFETFRKKKAKRKLRTGKSEYVWNDEDKIQTRESPHLRIVSDHLWYTANEVVDKRRVFQRPVRGAGPAPPGGSGGGRAAIDARATARGQCVRRAAAGKACQGDRGAAFGGKDLQGDRQGTGHDEGPHAELCPYREADGGRGDSRALPPADGEARPGVAVVQQALAEGGRPKGRGQTPPGFLTSGTRGRRRWLRLRSPDFMSGGGLPLPGVLDDGREIVPELFSDASPSRVNVFDRRVAIRRFLCHRSTTPRACR